MNATCLIVAGALLLFPAIPAGSYSIGTDGDLSDWMLPGPPAANYNSGHIVTDTQGRGEYVWRDAAGDERTDIAQPDPECDLLELRLTGDTDYLYIAALFTDLGLAPGLHGVAQLQLAIDTNLISGSGQSWFAHAADTRAAAEARWERLVVTTFGGNGTSPLVYDSSFTPVAAVNAAQAYSASANAIEIQVRWHDLGLGGQPAGPLRFTAAVFHADLSDQTVDIGGSLTANAIDAVTTNGDPGGFYNTWSEVSDAVVHYYWDVWFGLTPDGNPAAPVQVSEIYYVTDGDDADLEFIEIFNATGRSIDLANYKIGDEENLTQNAEAMMRLGSGVIGSRETLVLAARGTPFYLAHGFHATWEQQNTTPVVPNTSIYANWSTGLLIRLDNGGDEVLLVDAADTVVDVVTYEAGAYPGNLPHPEVFPGISLHRNPMGVDSGDCAQDFEPLSPPDPFRYPGGPTPTPVPVPQTSAAGLLLLIAAVTAALAGSGRRR